MKTIRDLNIKDWSGYVFEEVVNILDIDPDGTDVQMVQ